MGGYDKHHDCGLQQPDRLRDLFQAILAIPSISMIHGIWTYDLASVKPRLYASVMTRLKTLYFRRELTKEQFENIFSTVAEEGTKVEEIDIDFSGYTFVLAATSSYLGISSHPL